MRMHKSASDQDSMWPVVQVRVSALEFPSELWHCWLVDTVPLEQERTRCILDETEKIEKQSLRDA